MIVSIFSVAPGVCGILAGSAAGVFSHSPSLFGLSQMSAVPALIATGTDALRHVIYGPTDPCQRRTTERGRHARPFPRYDSIDFQCCPGCMRDPGRVDEQLLDTREPRILRRRSSMRHLSRSVLYAIKINSSGLSSPKAQRR